MRPPTSIRDEATRVIRWTSKRMEKVSDRGRSLQREREETFETFNLAPPLLVPLTLLLLALVYTLSKAFSTVSPPSERPQTWVVYPQETLEMNTRK